MTTTTKRMKIHEEEEEEVKPNPGGTITTADRISELPKEILHRILGFLEMDELLIQTSLVSARWRNLWKFVPTLTFDQVCVITGSVEKHHNFVDHVLRLRHSRIQIFNYYFHSGSIERLHNYIVSAVNQGAQQIQIKGLYSDDDETNIHFNPSIFNSGQLRVFDFRLIDTSYVIQFPRSMCYATQLTHLSLSWIRLPDGDLINAELHLEVLMDLVRYRIEIRTPNLTSLGYSGHVYVDCFTENLPRIVNASLIISEETGNEASFATKLLKGLNSAETLSLTLGGFEVFSQDTLKVLLTPFSSIRTLNLVTTCEISSIRGMVHILNICNFVENLVWIVSKTGAEEGDEHFMLPECRLSYLKHVHIKSLHGHNNELDMVKFLLKSSVVLEDLTINLSINSSKRSIEENLEQFIEEEPSFSSIKLHIL